MLSIQKVIAIVSGCLLIAVGIDFFLAPNRVLDGGLIGIALIAKYLFGVKVGLILFLCSIPVFLLAWVKDKSIFFHSLYGMIFLSYFIDALDTYGFLYAGAIKAHPFTAAVVGGLLIGVGFGILLRFDTSTGGIDLLAKLLSVRLRVNVGVLILITDAIVVVAGGLLFSADTLFLSIAAISAGGLATSLCTVKHYYG